MHFIVLPPLQQLLKIGTGDRTIYFFNEDRENSLLGLHFSHMIRTTSAIALVVRINEDRILTRFPWTVNMPIGDR
jgi:hypothetical protein